MPDKSPYAPPTEGFVSKRRRSLRPWFAAGFLFVFVGMLLLVNQFFYTGDVLIQCKLWQFYLLEIQRWFTSSGNIGPTSGSGAQALTGLLTHVALSVVAGLLAMGLGAIVRRFRA